MLDVASHMRRVQPCVSVKLHHKGPLQGESGTLSVILCHPAYSLVLDDCASDLLRSRGRRLSRSYYEEDTRGHYTLS